MLLYAGNTIPNSVQPGLEETTTLFLLFRHPHTTHVMNLARKPSTGNIAAVKGPKFRQQYIFENIPGID